FGAAATMIAVTALPIAAPIVALVGALIHIGLNPRRGVLRSLFSLLNPPLAAGAAVVAYELVRPSSPEFSAAHLLAALAAAMSFYLVNSLVVAVVVSIAQGRSLASVLR